MHVLNMLTSFEIMAYAFRYVKMAVTLISVTAIFCVRNILAKDFFNRSFKKIDACF